MMILEGEEEEGEEVDGMVAKRVSNIGLTSYQRAQMARLKQAVQRARGSEAISKSLSAVVPPLFPCSSIKSINQCLMTPINTSWNLSSSSDAGGAKNSHTAVFPKVLIITLEPLVLAWVIEGCKSLYQSMAPGLSWHGGMRHCLVGSLTSSTSTVLNHLQVSWLFSLTCQYRRHHSEGRHSESSSWSPTLLTLDED
ncbi:hypothetical protein Tsubulata_002513 [Turnera subulata]|uniref:Uncharacterized protein n=1 Tax=Turnera subulata TaxID=218843 RepID=A0A9Q0FJR8_9ROSI|nr:hypothetical protein Tsubulata_002513 [Turnera subulata]